MGFEPFLEIQFLYVGKESVLQAKFFFACEIRFGLLDRAALYHVGGKFWGLEAMRQ
jgi:hypothetical protein